MRRLIVLPLLIYSFADCNNKRNPTLPVNRAFYYWKSVYRNNSAEQTALKNLKVNTVYTKFFDVDWNYDESKCFPLAQINFRDKPDTSLNIIPCVFITNRSIANIDSANIPGLADNISNLLDGIIVRNGFKKINELQIDCDWTEKTKGKYFLLLTELKKKDLFQNKLLSATIRLFQLKFINRCGIPPVDKGLLMAYNMGNLKNASSENSILDHNVLEDFAAHLSGYPLKLDIALPLFGWYVWFDNKQQYKGLIHDFSIPPPEFFPVEKNANRYIFKSTFDSLGYSFQTGDVLRKEESKADEILKAAKTLSAYLKKDTLTLCCFHLDSITLKKYSANELEEIFNSLSH